MNHDCRGDGVAVRLATRKTLAFDCTAEWGTAECSWGHGAAALLPYKQQSFVLGAACVAAAGVCGNESPRAACGHRKAFGEQSLERGSGHLSRRHHQNCRARQASIDAARTTN